MDVNVLRGERIEIFKAAVVCVDDLAGDIAGAGGAVVRHDDARVVLLRIAIHVLARGAGHERMAGFVPGLNVDGFGVVEEHAIGNDFGFEAGGAEFARDELGGFVILWRGGQMRLGGESGEVVAGVFWIGHGEEFLFLLCFGVEVGKAEAALRHGLGWGLGGRRAGRSQHENSSRKNKGKCGTGFH